jgi:hypothetical protein
LRGVLGIFVPPGDCESETVGRSSIPSDQLPLGFLLTKRRACNQLCICVIEEFAHV